MRRISHREYKIRKAWIEQQWNEASRTDHYLMQIAQYLDAIWRKKGKLKELAGFFIPFKRVPVQKDKNQDEWTWTSVFNKVTKRGR